ncbi:hypothetical protein GCM10011611_28950 [Aliidongia dinghuensis]|uniref:DNA helicase DnaB-like N-terminal domain-containing protein n=2 Tax=Aliidongia dinghuensis TaxID=1867774 RepID=A0A8J3E2H0_9PROT|nr:hypothetical protein GCM10011611_28950 [Aliidongia dinghuensis]
MAGAEDDRSFSILDAERELIAAILVDNRAYRAVCHFLQPAHFLSPRHRRQFATIAAAVEAGRPVDLRLLEGAGRPMLDPPKIDPLDHALMIYGSFLGRAAVGAAIEEAAPARVAS